MACAEMNTVELVKRLGAVWNSPSGQGADELYAHEYCGYDLTSRLVLNGPDDVARHIQRLARAFPDLVFQIVRAVAENDCMTVFWSASGTHCDTLMNIPATGRRVQVQGVALLVVQNERITRGVHLWDMAGLLRGMDLLPELAQHAPFDLEMVQRALNG